MTPKLLSQTPNFDVYQVDGDGSVVHVQIVALFTGMPLDLLDACRIRRRATVTGQCPGCTYLERPFHTKDCPAEYRLLKDALERWERSIRRFERGQRITENPADTVGMVYHGDWP